MKHKKIARKLLWTLGAIFLLMNIMAGFHAWKFTHFDPAAKSRTENKPGISLIKKVGLLFTGVSLPRPYNAVQPSLPYETVMLQSNKRIECWWIKRDSAMGTVILCHGYGGNKASMLDRAMAIYDMGYNVFLPDFMGGGASEGNQCTIGFKEAEQVKTCVDYIAKQGEQNIFLFGTSMGAAASMKACAEHTLPVRGLMLECPFGSMRQTVKNRFSMVGVPAFPLSDLLVFWGGVENGFNAFNHNPEDYAKQIKSPVLLLYGERDDRVTREEIDNIFNNLTGPKTLVTYPLAGHESYLNDYATQWKGDVQRFLEGVR